MTDPAKKLEGRLASLRDEGASKKPLSHEDLARRLAALNGSSSSSEAKASLQQRLAAGNAGYQAPKHSHAYMAEEDKLISQVQDELHLSQPWRRELPGPKAAVVAEPTWEDLARGPKAASADSIAQVLEEAKFAAEVEGGSPVVPLPEAANASEGGNAAGNTDDVQRILQEAQASIDRGEVYGYDSDDSDSWSEDD